MAYNPNMKKFIAGSVTAAVVASAIAPAAASAASKDFTDVKDGFWAKHEIDTLVEKGVIKGYPDNTFKPSQQLVRGQAANLLTSALALEIPADLKSFSDVSEKSAFAEGAAATKKAEIFKGSNGKFGASDVLTREQMASVIVRAFKLKDTGAKVEFKDQKSISASHADNVKILAQHKITTGKADGTFAPKESVNRATFVAFLYRAMDQAGLLDVAVADVKAVEVAADNQLKVTGTDLDKLTVENFTLEGNKVTKVEADKEGKSAILTFEKNFPVNVAQKLVYTKTVDGKPVATEFTFTSKFEVVGVSAINATQVEVKFNTPVNKTAAEAVDGSQNSTVVSIEGVTLKTPSLSEDGKTLTLTAASKIDVKNATVAVNPVQTKADANVKTAKFVSLITYKDTVAPTITSVEAKTNGTKATELTVKASEPIQSALAKVNGSYVTVNFNGTDKATISGLSLETGKTHTIELVNLEDKAGNKTVSTSANFSVSIDSVAPTATLTAVGDKGILVTFSKKMDVASVEAALATSNNPVKDEALANIATGNATVVDNTNNTQFLIPVLQPNVYQNKDSRTFTVVLADTIKDSIGNKLAATTQKVTLSKDTVKPVAVGYNVIKDADGKVKAIEVNFSEGLKADTFTPVTTLHDATSSIVNENGVAETTKFTNFKAKAVAAGDKKVVFEAATAEAINGKYAFSFKNELVSDLAETQNKSAVFNYTIDFGQPEAATEFELAAAPQGTGNVITVTFPESVKGGAVANSATDLANYTLGGKPLPEGTTIILDPTQKIATITLPEGSVAKDDQAAVFTASNIKNIAGTKTLKTYTGTVSVVDNVKPVLDSAKVLDNKTIELTYSEAVQLTGTNVGNSFEIKQGTDVLSLADAELTATVASGFPTKLVLKIEKGTDAVGTPATSFAQPEPMKKATANTGTGNVTIKGTFTGTADEALTVEKTATGWTVNGIDASEPAGDVTIISYKGMTIDLSDTVTKADAATGDQYTISLAAAKAGTSATTLDLTKDITIETKDSTVVKDKATTPNTQKAGVKVTVVKP